MAVRSHTKHLFMGAYCNIFVTYIFVYNKSIQCLTQHLKEMHVLVIDIM